MTQAILSHIERRPGLSFNASLVIGAMIATLAVVAFAGLSSPVSAVRAHIVLQGAQVVLLTLAAGAIASALHAFSLSDKFSRLTANESAQRDALAA